MSAAAAAPAALVRAEEMAAMAPVRAAAMEACRRWLARMPQPVELAARRAVPLAHRMAQQGARVGPA